MLEGALNAIRSELARLEVFDRNLFVISPEDAEQQIPANAHLREICDPLGANLALTAFGVPGSKHLQLILRLLNPSSDKSIREREVTCSFSDPASLPGKAVQAAARLLDVNRFLQVSGRTEAGTQSPAAYNAFQSAESLIRQPNDTGLDAAIDKYKEAIQLDPNYAIAHAELAQAYVHLYGIRHDPGALDLARGNSDRSLALDRRLVDGYLARAVLFEQTGNEQGALEEFSKALALDPSNPDTLRLQAGIYTRLNRWADAEKTYNLVVKERPNSWVAYNQLGFVLHEQGKYRDAIRSFRAASLAAPKSTMALTNLGAEYIQVGEFTEATDALKKSMSLHPSDFAAATMSLALRCQSRYQEALPFALKAVELNPSEDANWLELGDCYSSLPNRRNESRNAYRRAALETQRHLQTDPANGANWMMLALYRTKSGSPETAPALMQKAESLGAGDMDSQISKARTLELLGKRDEALATLAACFRKGATSLQIVPFPDMQSLRKDPRYRQMLQPASAATEAN
jgi:tetratricopeptide (TPR) repeat protein